ncbi:FtsX-like permease family protein [Dactylosporangium sucinum]|uniref:ABC transporter permease n=1 Tax=Dactylosporangium sucinum TaxID=1424081 RepID=A0A917T5Y5_9ACTN|nr:ABC transporter permease [Dactylosporangium sucinum]GGM11729.1 ABC transporter permease [Dactylosporangium sucinum]
MLRRITGAFVAVAIGVALVAAATLLLASGRAKVPDRFAAAPVVVAGPEASTPGMPFPPARPWSSADAQTLGARLASLPGVAEAVPDRTFYAQVSGHERDRPEGHGWSSARLGGLELTAGAPPARPGEVVVGEQVGAAPGTAVTLLTAAGPQRYLVTGVVAAPLIFVADDVAAGLAPGVSTIGLRLEPGADAGRVAADARDVVGTGGRVLTGDGRGALEPRADARLRWIGMQALTGTAALGGFVTVFVVASTFAFTVAQRRRELGLLRAIGATPGQVRRMVLGEALAVGAAGSVAGLLVGAVLAPGVGRILVWARLEPTTFEVRFTVWPVLVSLAVGPVVAVLGAWSAARRAARVGPLEALREAAVEQRPMGWARWVLGAVLLAVGVALAIGTAASDDAQDGATFALYSAMALVTGVTALAPAAVPPIVRLCRLPVRTKGGAVGLLVRESALTAARRTASTAAPVLLTVAFAVLVSGMVHTSTEAYAAGRAADADAGWTLVPQDGVPGLSEAVVAAVPGRALLPTTGYVDVGNKTEARSVVGVARPDLTGDGVVVPAGSGRRVGEALAVVFADGERVTLRVTALEPDGSLPAELVVSRDTVRRHDPSALTPAIQLGERIELPADSGARVVDVRTWAAEADAEEDRLVWVFTMLLIAVSAGYGAIAVANTLLMAAAGRAPDLRVLRLTGATRRQVTRFVLAESSLMVLIGAVLGGAVAFGALLSIRAGLSEQVGAPVDLVVPWPVVGGVVGLCLLLAVLAGVATSRRAWVDTSRQAE